MLAQNCCVPGPCSSGCLAHMRDVSLAWSNATRGQQLTTVGAAKPYSLLCSVSILARHRLPAHHTHCPPVPLQCCHAIRHPSAGELQDLLQGSTHRPDPPAQCSPPGVIYHTSAFVS